jgi:hypothetical protein
MANRNGLRLNGAETELSTSSLTNAPSHKPTLLGFNLQLQLRRLKGLSRKSLAKAFLVRQGRWPSSFLNRGQTMLPMASPGCSRAKPLIDCEWPWIALSRQL